MYLSDEHIAKQAQLWPIEEVAQTLGISKDQLYQYGPYQAKIVNDKKEVAKKGHTVLVTAISPTPAGEGKTTTTIGLGDALKAQGESVAIALREPSMGPVFGKKGGAAGGGKAQIVPMEDINLHFTGDFHAITSAHNLLMAMLENHLFQGNTLNIDPERIVWGHVIDMNDRSLRHIVTGLKSSHRNGIPHESYFELTVASEVMAIFCLAKDQEDLKKRLGRIIVAYTYEGNPVTADDLQATGAMFALLHHAFYPNLVQTIEHTPAFVHGGPFANIAHGCNSVVATKLAQQHADYVITEAGFGADLGAEKYLDILSRDPSLAPDAVVLVATVRALKYHGGLDLDHLTDHDDQAKLALTRGLDNLLRHLDNLEQVFGQSVVVAINVFPTDIEEEWEIIKNACRLRQTPCVLSNVWAEGGLGGAELAEAVKTLIELPNEIKYAYELTDPLSVKIEKLVNKVYRGSEVIWSSQAKQLCTMIEESPWANYPVCVAKTPYSFSADANNIGAADQFVFPIEGLRVCAGAGFIVAYAQDILTMPGLPKRPAAEDIDVIDSSISGLF